MKSPEADLHQKLEELAAGLDAGWDELEQSTEPPTAEPPAAEPASASQPAPASVAPHSAAPNAALDDIDAEWDAPERNERRPAQRSKERVKNVRPPQTQPQSARSTLAVHVSKRERREQERLRRAHEAQQRSARKQERKAARREDAAKASEVARREQERAQAERRERAALEQEKRERAAAERTKKVKSPDPKRVHREHARAAAATELTRTKAKPVTVAPPESTWKKLIIPFFIALLVGGTLCFALMRAR